MTRKLILIAGVAGLAIAAPAQGERGARERDAQASEKIEQRKAQRAERQQMQAAERPQRMERQQIRRAERAQQVERQQIPRMNVQAERRERGERQRLLRSERGPQFERQEAKRAARAERRDLHRIERAEKLQAKELKQIRRAERAPRVERQKVQRAERRSELAAAAGLGSNHRQALRAERREHIERLAAQSRRIGPLFGERAIVRPMKVKHDRGIIAVGDRVDPARFSSFVPTPYRARYFDTPDYYYRYDNDLGYLYRIDRDDHFVQALIPLFGGYSVGDPWPNMYNSSYVPLGYRGYYYDTPDYYHRYDGNGIYRIDAKTQLITALVALLTGNGFGIGSLLPSSYGAYNVPMAYRSTYYDRSDAWYRYGDGFIYEVDPYSRRIEARYPIYGAGYDYMVGEPWPVAYPGYNVPYGYQSLYYDTPQHHYRYANGGIYQIDPTTQVIMALVALVSGNQQFAVGQPLPSAFAAYNVPFAYRDRYYDDEDDWYRYADGYIYRVDPYRGRVEEAIPVYA